MGRALLRLPGPVQQHQRGRGLADGLAGRSLHPRARGLWRLRHLGGPPHRPGRPARRDDCRVGRGRRVDRGSGCSTEPPVLLRRMGVRRRCDVRHPVRPRVRRCDRMERRRLGASRPVADRHHARRRAGVDRLRAVDRPAVVRAGVAGHLRGARSRAPDDRAAARVGAPPTLDVDPHPEHGERRGQPDRAIGRVRRPRLHAAGRRPGAGRLRRPRRRHQPRATADQQRAHDHPGCHGPGRGWRRAGGGPADSTARCSVGWDRLPARSERSRALS